MSEQQNTQLIQKLFEAFGRGDVQTILDHCTADCEFDCPGPEFIPYTGKTRGRDEIRRSYFEPLLTTQRDQDLKIDQYVAQGDTVVAIGRYSAIVSATNKQLQSPVVLVFELREGSVKRNFVLADTAALAVSYTAPASAAGR